MSNDPDQIRHEIEATRASLSRNVDALAENVTPSAIARHQVSKVTGAVSGLKDSIMGTASEVSASASDRVSSVAGAPGTAKQAVARQTRGNPLAAGAVALAAGWLLGSLLPASQKEAEAVASLKESATSAVDAVKEHAAESADTIKSSATESAQTVKDAATE